MIPLPPLAFELGDLIFLIFVVVAGVVQFIGGLKKKKQGQEPYPEEPDPSTFEPFPGSETRREEPRRPEEEVSWDDLMEALGQRPTDARPEPVQPAPEREVFTPPPPPLPIPAPAPVARSTPPPVPAAAPLEPELSESVRNMLSVLESRSLTLSTLEHSPGSEQALAATETREAAQATLRAASPRLRFAEALRSRTELRRAIVLQELLQPPVAFR